MSEAPTAPKLPPAYRLHAYDSLPSTNDEARRLAAAGADEGTLVWALEQTSGRGRRGRGWASPRGNLYLSLVLRPDGPLSEAAQLGFVAALAVVDALGSTMPPLTEVRLKWPNDVLVADRKVAGLLLESVADADGGLDALILGVGINVDSAPDDTAYPATCLAREGGREVTVESLLQAWARHFLTRVNRWTDEGFAPIRSAWLNRAKGQGEPVEVRLPERTLTGTFRDLDETGALLLDTAAGPERVTAGDVFFPDADAGESDAGRADA
jgi:BirA family biotin operon repressor/biotin-[acetyl-CoA-carboxylase] ligase